MAPRGGSSVQAPRRGICVDASVWNFSKSDEENMAVPAQPIWFPAVDVARVAGLDGSGVCYAYLRDGTVLRVIARRPNVCDAIEEALR